MCVGVCGGCDVHVGPAGSVFFKEGFLKRVLCSAGFVQRGVGWQGFSSGVCSAGSGVAGFLQRGVGWRGFSSGEWVAGFLQRGVGWRGFSSGEWAS